MLLANEKWYKAIFTRRSRRTFVAKLIEQDVTDKLKLTMNQINDLNDGVRVVLIEKNPDPVILHSVGPYGKITGAPAYFVIIGKTNTKDYLEKSGYIGQAMVLEAAVNSLSTCWVGGYFDREITSSQIPLKENETVVAVIPVGYARKNLSLTEKMMNQVAEYHKRKPIEELIEGLPRDQWPEWLESTIKAASLAPSAYNRQPLRFFIDEDFSITISIYQFEEETNVSKHIDRGIAMLHMDVALQHFRIKGSWSHLPLKNEVKFIS